MRLVIESPDDRLHVVTTWALLRRALPADVVVEDGPLKLLLNRSHQPASDPTPAQTEPPHPAADRPKT